MPELELDEVASPAAPPRPPLPVVPPLPVLEVKPLLVVPAHETPTAAEDKKKTSAQMYRIAPI
jgi:hypothetical protein